MAGLKGVINSKMAARTEVAGELSSLDERALKTEARLSKRKEVAEGVVDAMKLEIENLKKDTEEQRQAAAMERSALGSRAEQLSQLLAAKARLEALESSNAGMRAMIAPDTTTTKHGDPVKAEMEAQWLQEITGKDSTQPGRRKRRGGAKKKR